MFDNSISIISGISRALKKYVYILSIVTQVMFLAYYTYLLVVNRENIYLLVLYSAITFLAFILLIINIVAVDITDFKNKLIKTKTKRIINIISWVFKAAVIGFNIYVIVTNPTTEANKMFLIFSSIFLIVQIMSSVISWLFSYYTDLFLFALKMDYESLLKDDEKAEDHPIGQYLNKTIGPVDRTEKVNEQVVKHELYGSIKDELLKEDPIKIKGKVVKRRKVEKVILHYYAKANQYYVSEKKIHHLVGEIDTKLSAYVNSSDKAFVLQFFVHNHMEHIYKGLSEYATKLIIANFLFLLDDNDKAIIDVTYNSILKELIDIKNWSAPDNSEKEKASYNRVDKEIDRTLSIVKASRVEYELYKDETILSEIESIALRKAGGAFIDYGKNAIKKSIRGIFHKDKE